jgi:hypothetical protein
MRPEAEVQIYILRRLLLMIPVLFGVSVIIFGILRASRRRRRRGRHWGWTSRSGGST